MDGAMSAVADRVEEQQLEAEQEVSPLELFFDLVFVFAITQVSGFVSHDATWTRLLEGLAILAALWFAWEAFVWLANTAASDEGAVRVVLLSTMGALLVASLAVPHAFDEDALVFGVAYLVVRIAHIAAYVIVSRDDPELRRVVVRLATTILPAAALLVLAGVVDAGAPRTACWIAALLVDYGGLVVRGVAGWRVEASHFAERHGLIVIIALGESVVAVGVGAGGLDLDAGLIVTGLLAMVVAGAMWWVYFDFVALVALRRLRAAPREERVRIARDSFTYLHLPMVAGIILIAVGIKKALPHIGDELEAVPAVVLCGGAALYLAALSAFKRRNIGSWNYPRLIAASALVVLAPVATAIPALVAVGLVAAVGAALVAYETVAYAEFRDRIRHGNAGP
jgi:low temperature requirement protein LtrA